MLSHRQKRTLLQILPFGIIPAIFSLLLSIVEKGVLGDHPIYPSTGNPYEFRPFIPALTSFFTGISIGVIEFFYLNPWFQKRRFTEKLLLKSIIYMLSIVIATLIILSLGHSLELGLSILDERVWEYVAAFFFDFAFWSIMCYFLLAIICSVFYVEVSNNIGQAVLLNLFTGKYHRPTEEERIYMFLDMKSSTTIAEQLGHVEYFQMLKEYYADLSNPIVDFGGEIYQYVGDEVVISWGLKPGTAENPLGCFFAMKNALSQQTGKYESLYGLVPDFKAGIHCGSVTTGEIGVIKKDIAFSGDVLNTTARIQGLCNTYGVELLCSGAYADALGPEVSYELSPLGEVTLRGRNEKIDLFTVQPL